VAAASEEAEGLTPLDQALLRRWISLVTEVLLPLFFLRLWLAPEAAFDDGSFSLLIVLMGENLILGAMLLLPAFAQWKLDDYKLVIGYGSLTLLVALAAFAGGWMWSAVAALLLLGRFLGVAVRKADAEDFPASRLQAFVALAIFWSLLFVLDFGNQHGVHVSANRNVGDMAAHGTVYFSAILGIRAFQLVAATRLRRGQKVAFEVAFGKDTPHR
jgi:hypothetical protein